MADQTRDIITIRSELEEAQKEYHETAGNMVEKDWRLLSDYVAQLRGELTAALTAGAVPCSRCGSSPHSLRHIRATSRGQQVQWKHVYEVGCVNCHDAPDDDRRGWGETPARPEGVDLAEYDDRAAADAVHEWNSRNGGKEEG
jgi:hypothetical protein